MIDLSKAQAQILDATPVLGRESVPILEALNRILVQDIVAVEDLPAADISAMDGYAVRHASLAGASARRPAHFKVIGESPAGRPCGLVVGAGDAVRIMTGGLVPAGTDTVVKLEETEETNGRVVCRHDPGCGGGIRLQGDSVKSGDVVLRAGKAVSPVEVGALASLRRAYVYVHRKPTVAILSTGDELSDFHDPPSPAKAMCSNLYALAAQVMDAGGIPLCLGIVADECAVLQSRLREALRAEVIITSGGTSRGKYDIVHAAFSTLGLEMRFSNMFKKPGKPTIFGTVGQKLIFGLPGNPSAAMLSFEQFIKPALLKMAGHREGAQAAGTVNPYFAFIDSFNYAQGGNKDHHRASQVPVAGTAVKPGISTPKRQPADQAAPAQLQMVSR